MSIGNKIRVLREIKGVSQEELAVVAGYSDKNSISKIEKDLNNIPIPRLQKIAKFFEKELSFFLEDKEDVIVIDGDFDLNIYSKERPKNKIDLINENEKLLRENNRLKTILINKSIDLNTLFSE